VIAARTPAATIQAARQALQRAISCVTSVVVSTQADTAETKLNCTGRLPRLSGGEAISLNIRHTFVLVHDASREARYRWLARTTGYLYALEAADGREILAYHWHPGGRSPVTTPHLHLGAAAGTLRRELEKAHLATGFVTPVALLTLLIEQFAVRPRRGDWAAVLDRAHRALDITTEEQR
jgi:hypothetical protein